MSYINLHFTLLYTHWLRPKSRQSWPRWLVTYRATWCRYLELADTSEHTPPWP